MKTTEAIMEILAAYDLTGSYRDAAALVGCSHHTVACYVRAREAGQPRTTPVSRDQLIDPFREKIEEWVDASTVECARTWRSASSRRWAMRARSGPRDAPSPRPSWRIGPATDDASDRGYRNQVCGSSGTTPTARSSATAKRGCGARGWRGAAFAWCCRFATRPYRRSSRASTRRCAGSVVYRRMA